MAVNFVFGRRPPRKGSVSFTGIMSKRAVNATLTATDANDTLSSLVDVEVHATLTATDAVDTLRSMPLGR